MIKAIFIDFYGTIVHEDGVIIKEITQEIFKTGIVSVKSDIGTYWWNEFQDAFTNAFGVKFRTQRELEYQSLSKTIEHFKSSANAVKLSEKMFRHWMHPPIFEESKEFLSKCPIPVYIVSNIDRNDILEAIRHHELSPSDVFTSEDAKSYKPRKELFEYALKNAGFEATDVIHIGDSLNSDVKGASDAGIPAVWVNRGNKEVPPGVFSVNNLMDVLETKYSNS